MSRRRWRWVAVAGLALSLVSCAGMPGEDGGGAPPTPMTSTDDSTLSCGEATYNQAVRELGNAADRDRTAAYKACDGLTQAQVNGLISKAIGGLAAHEGDTG
ncbi:hypothetical protein [Streptomyces sp. NPDC003710]